jgi:hypothetical protein
MDNQETTTTGTVTDTGTENISMTKADYEKALQAEADKRVAQALKTARTKWDSEVGNKIDSHLKDYERKAQMTPEQLKQMDIDEKFKLLDAKEKEYARKTREVEITQKLQAKKLSPLLTKYIYSDNMDDVEQNIATLEQLVLGMVNEEVEKRISSSKPKAVSTTGLTKEKFQKMTIAERQNLYSTNPSLYKELMGN